MPDTENKEIKWMTVEEKELLDDLWNGYIKRPTYESKLVTPDENTPLEKWVIDTICTEVMKNNEMRTFVNIILKNNDNLRK